MQEIVIGKIAKNKLSTRETSALIYNKKEPTLMFFKKELKLLYNYDDSPTILYYARPQLHS